MTAYHLEAQPILGPTCRVYTPRKNCNANLRLLPLCTATQSPTSSSARNRCLMKGRWESLVRIATSRCPENTLPVLTSVVWSRLPAQTVGSAKEPPVRLCKWTKPEIENSKPKLTLTAQGPPIFCRPLQNPRSTILPRRKGYISLSFYCPLIQGPIRSGHDVHSRM